ncbi:MAG TPA: site-2 protease family protein, partial [Pyrinomonadaceae bacterium]|nr:site-2 protease family protein [Pyrinomonadaceae bacterium]
GHGVPPLQYSCCSEIVMRWWQFYKRRLTVARVYGIPVRIDYRWFVVVALSVWLISSNLQSHTIQLGNVRLEPLPSDTAWLLGIITTAGLFLSVFGHELSHALMGRAEGIEIEEIVLHPFGGLARLRTEPESPRAELRIAVAGPAASFLFAILAFAATKIAALGNYNATVVVFFLIAWGNLLLAVFNLFPGYPLDGGRVLRAILWRRSGSIVEATRLAGLCGILIGATLILFGVYIMIAPNWRPSQPYFMGAWSILVGLFLLDTAARVVKRAQSSRVITVGETMSAPIAIEPEATVSKIVDEILPLHRHTSFPVALNRRLHGILSLEDLKSLPRERWRDTRVREVMHPIGPRFFVGPSATLDFARELMKRNGVGSLAVVNNDGDLVGFLHSGRVRRRPANRT